jgi:hypothetical protein
MIFAKDADNSWYYNYLNCLNLNTKLWKRIITGSFDRVVKLWSLDGNLLQRFDGFM